MRLLEGKEFWGGELARSAMGWRADEMFEGFVVWIK